MNFPVTINGELRLAEAVFATGKDAARIATWARLPVATDNLAVRDAAEFAGLACKRWRFYRRVGRLAANVGQMHEAVTHDAEAEVAVLLVARADWHGPSPQMGVCLCRRTWGNNLCLDFLAVDPRHKREGAAKVVGIATGLLFLVAELTLALKAKCVWGEATPLSAGFYRHQFSQPDITDFFRLSRPVLRRFRARTLMKWAQSGLPLDGTRRFFAP